MSGLIIPFDPAGLPPKLVNALDDLIVAVQTWSGSPSGLATKRLRAQSATQTITSSADPFAVKWLPPSSDGDTLYDTGGFLESDRVFVNFTQVGTYLMSAQCRFAASAAGFRYAGIFGVGDFDVRKQIQVPSAGANELTIDTGTLLLRVTAPPVKLRVGVFQNSGAGLALLTSYLEVVQLMG